MRTAQILLVASHASLAITAFFFGRSSVSNETLFKPGAISKTVLTTKSVIAPPKDFLPSLSNAASLDWALIETNDYRAYITNLRGIHCPEPTIKDIIIADINKLYAGRLRALSPTRRITDPVPSIGDPKQYERERDRRALLRERRELIVSLLGPGALADLDEIAGKPSFSDDRFTFLSEDKRELALEIEEKYRHLENAVGWKAHGFSLPEDDLARRQLREQLDQEMAKLMSPRELALYHARSSGTLNLVELRQRFQPSENELIAVYDYEATFRSVRSTVDSGFMSEVSDTDTKLRQSLGEERYREYLRSKDPAYRDFFNLSQRLELPSNVAEELYSLKTRAEEQRATLIRNGHPEQLTALMDSTAQTAKSLLGDEGYRAYEARASSRGWIQRLGNSK